MKLKFGDAVEVQWEDACSYGGWREPYDEGPLITSVGMFVKQSRKGLCLMRGAEMPDKDQVLGPSFIPRGMVRKIRRLR